MVVIHSTRKVIASPKPKRLHVCCGGKMRMTERERLMRETLGVEVSIRTALGSRRLPHDQEEQNVIEPEGDEEVPR